MPTLALCVICHDRPDELPFALASAPGFDDVVVVDMASSPPLEPVPGTRWNRCDHNEGVAAGRNRQATMTDADILVFLDDDARFVDTDAADRIRDVFADHPMAGAVAFRVQRPGGSVVAIEHPFRGRAHDTERARPCAYFVGCGAAVRRTAFEVAGGFDARFQYSTEEIDLAFALARSGWDLRYEPSIRVEHRPSSRGRGIAPEIPALRLRNRLLMVRRHLPMPVASVHALAWGARTFAESLRGRAVRPYLRAWLRAWCDGMRLPVHREPLPYRSLARVHHRGGRVFW